MTPEEQQILHHHAAAIDWLCEKLRRRGGSTEGWREAALRYALIMWETQTPEQLSGSLNRNLTALQALACLSEGRIVTEQGDPVVLWDEEGGSITDSQLIEIVETVRLQQQGDRP